MKEAFVETKLLESPFRRDITILIKLGDISRVCIRWVCLWQLFVFLKLFIIK